MLLLADAMAEFIKKNRTYGLLGLFVLLIPGIVLLGKGGHEAHLTLLGYAVQPLDKTTFYVSIAVLLIVQAIHASSRRNWRRNVSTRRVTRNALTLPLYWSKET